MPTAALARGDQFVGMRIDLPVAPIYGWRRTMSFSRSRIHVLIANEETADLFTLENDGPAGLGKFASAVAKKEQITFKGTKAM